MLPQTCLPVAAGSMQTADDSLLFGVDPTLENLPLTKTSPRSVEMTVKEEIKDLEQQEVQDGSNVASQLISNCPSSISEPTKQFEDGDQLRPSDFPTSSPRDDGRKTTTRGRRRSRWKLKFHHQALPPEYLDHYEASMAQQDASNTRGRLIKNKSSNEPCINIKADRDSPDSTNLSRGISQSLLEQLCSPLPSKNNVAHRSQNVQKTDDRGKYCDRNLQSKCLLGTLLLDKDGKQAADDYRKRSSVIMSSALSSSSARANPVSNSQGTKVVKYQDLPYMGEITLDNMKPRRGRKPKKADICHLIYKNYGTIFSGGPKIQDKGPQSSLTHTTKVKSDSDVANNLRCKAIDSLKNNTPINHTDVQNRIISSLLEKRLTAASQDSRKGVLGNSEGLLAKNVDISGNAKRESSIDEPLNLCVKDLNQLKIRLLRKHGNFYEPRSNNSVIKTEFNDLQEIDIDGNDDAFLENAKALNTPLEYDSLPSLLNLPFSSDAATSSIAPNSTLPGGYVYWPNAGVFVHPMALQSQLLYYQKMGSIPLLPLSSGENASSLPPVSLPSQNVNLSAKIASSTPRSSKSVAPAKPIVPKAFSVMVDSGIKNSVMPSELTFPRMKRLAPSGNLPSMGTPAKRKRSAIFIPPMPSDNNANPTTEVSICKFKFTGGAKPSLQEKKMLSVDSGGNFRYYSGTGDKSMRGYEFFPRESLQQMGNNVESPSEVFLTASALGSGEKLSTPNMPKEISKSSRTETVTNVSPRSQTQQQSTDFGEGSSNCFNHQILNPRIGPERLPPPGTFNAQHLGTQDEEIGSQFRLRRKRKTRKSLAREKLEQTFKEKGFLIQTQQLESAEGATYCKFRQLRKFTRYLFRSWKDYLPGNVREMSVAAGVGGSQDSEPEEQSCSSPPTPQTVPSVDDAHSRDTHQAFEHNTQSNKQSH